MNDRLICSFVGRPITIHNWNSRTFRNWISGYVSHRVHTFDQPVWTERNSHGCSLQGAFRRFHIILCRITHKKTEAMSDEQLIKNGEQKSKNSTDSVWYLSLAEKIYTPTIVGLIQKNQSRYIYSNSAKLQNEHIKCQLTMLSAQLASTTNGIINHCHSLISLSELFLMWSKNLITNEIRSKHTRADKKKLRFTRHSSFYV